MPYAAQGHLDYKKLYEEDYFHSRGMRTLFDEPYDSKHFDQFFTKLQTVAPVTRETRVLDLASGLGSRAWHLSKHAKSVDAVDIAPTANEFARKHYERENLTFHEADILTWEGQGTYDLVLLVSIYEHLTREDQDALMERAKRWLAPGGRLAVHVAIGESFLGRRKLRKSPTGTIDFTGDPTHLHAFDVPTIHAHFAQHGYMVAAEFRRYSSYLLSGRMWERIFRWFRVPMRWRNEFVLELLPAYSLRP